jgi:hypothetical protein
METDALAVHPPQHAVGPNVWPGPVKDGPVLRVTDVEGRALLLLLHLLLQNPLAVRSW